MDTFTLMSHPSEYIKMEYLNNIAKNKTKAKISDLLKLEIDKEIEDNIVEDVKNVLTLEKRNTPRSRKKYS